MENNQAVVVMLKNITKIPNADKIVQAEVHLNEIKLTQVIVGVETEENTPMVYFDSNVALNEKLTTDYPELGKYLGKGNRVKAVKLKGVISNGLCIELEKLVKYFDSEERAARTLIEGYSFDKINEQEICRKYVPKANIPSQGLGKKKKPWGKVTSRMIPNQFNFHFDTKQFLKNVHRLQPDDIISISEKWHGTSAITSNCMVKRKLPLKDWIAKRLGVKVVETEYDFIYASRRVVKNGKFQTKGNFYGEDIWKAGSERFRGRLNQGESVYFEIVGFLSDGKYIQKKFDYGCEPFEHKIVVYRITYTGPDGVVYEYPWNVMKQRCQELGVDPVKEFYYGKAKYLYPELSITEHWHENLIANLRRDYLEKDCSVCKNKVPVEGIVIRIEGKEIESFKMKSEAFLALDSKMKDEGEEDMEDIN